MKHIYTAFLALLVATAATAQDNNALSFDGTDDFCFSAGTFPSGNTARTVETWVKPTLVTPTQMVICSFGNMSNGQRFTLNVLNGLPRIEIGGSGISGPSSLGINTWHHVATTYNPLATPTVKLYVDGAVVASGDFTLTPNTDPLGGILIGRRQDSLKYFQGNIDELRVWNVALTDAVIAANYQQAVCTAPPELVAYYDFNQGIANGDNSAETSLVDASGNGNSATLNGFALNGTTSNFVMGAPVAGQGSSNATIASCGPYTVPGGNTYDESGTFVDTVITNNGCQSIITTNLTVVIPDTSVTQNGNLLISGNQIPGASYQWLDCNNNYAHLPLGTSNVYTVTANGSYALRISFGDCADTSNCHNVVVSGIEENMAAGLLTAYPNPTKDRITLEGGRAWAGAEYILTDLMGRTVRTGTLPSEGRAELELGDVPAAPYIIEVRSVSGVQRIAVQKQ